MCGPASPQQSFNFVFHNQENFHKELQSSSSSSSSSSWFGLSNFSTKRSGSWMDHLEILPSEWSKKHFSNHFQLTSLVNVVLEMKPMMKFLTQYLYLTMLVTNWLNMLLANKTPLYIYDEQYSVLDMLIHIIQPSHCHVEVVQFCQ